MNSVSSKLVEMVGAKRICAGSLQRMMWIFGTYLCILFNMVCILGSAMLLVSLHLWKEMLGRFIHCSPVAGESGWIIDRGGSSGSAFYRVIETFFILFFYLTFNALIFYLVLHLFAVVFCHFCLCSFIDYFPKLLNVA